MRLPELIGLSRAMDMILTGRPVDAREAFSFGECVSYHVLYSSLLLRSIATYFTALQLQKHISCLGMGSKIIHYCILDRKESILVHPQLFLQLE